ncbi:response regulator [Pseudoroseicyclus tamaricis]|uniref:Response regulator n=1 Tax=Pseudoroseicyclus tamaricis TaxID=2705421 RepID=A0A6B2K1Q1_9RHOB|nr:response regulator [Pseudoroseicyclus tamaricis]NDV00306.1 response regulator [Pseudoroseicyclus tamaricis]
MAKPTILVVEDEWLVAIDIVEELEAAGYEVIGPAHCVADALSLLEPRSPVAAVLDVNLRGETSYPIADALEHRGVPFTFLSSYTRSQLDEGYQNRPLLSKPMTPARLISRLGEMLGD